ncbi:MAG: hypothetical protein IT429_21500 [Gemmataceae bacterium]|nr:hypothetical protein [Gemmataceae bacterium]
MRRAQVVIYEHDSRLTDLLRERADAHGWSLREVRHAGACLRLLQRGGGALVLRIGRDLEREFTLLERVSRLCPDSGVVVVGDADSAAVGGLAWDLGARYVLLPPQPREHLPELVEGLMRSADEPPGVR